MRPMLTKLRTTLRRLHRDEGGSEGLEKLLIMAAVTLPLLGLLIVFRKDLTQWVEDFWAQIRQDGQ